MLPSIRLLFQPVPTQKFIMTSTEYSQWCDLSGIYVANVSHGDRYKTYVKQLSAEGLAVVIVCDFLNENEGGIDLQNWRDQSVYEANQLDLRLKLTADALRSVGASRLAGAVTQVKSNSPFDLLAKLDFSDPKAIQDAMRGLYPIDMFKELQQNLAHNFPEVAQQAGILPKQPPAPSAEHESREQLEHLLEQFVTKHQATLQADIDRHGDPRMQPGFTVEKRRAELDADYEKHLQREAQRDDLRKLENVVSRIEKLKPEAAVKGGDKLRTNYLKLIKKNQKITADRLIPEMATVLAKVEAFQTAHPAVFAAAPRYSPEIQQQLDALGEFEEELIASETALTWEKPNGFACDWVPLSLRLSFPCKHPGTLSTLLKAVDRLKKRLPTLTDTWRQELVESFRTNYQGQLGDWELEGYDFDDNEDATKESILKNVRGATISITAFGQDAEDLSTEAFFSVAWDEEHGYQLTWTDEPDSDTPSTPVQLDLGKVTISHSGSPVTPADIIRIESQFGIELPEEFRQFLLLHNGGEPQPKHLSLNRDGIKQHMDVVRFFGLTGEDSLKQHRKLPSGIEWPTSVQPIARVKEASLIKNLPDSFLLIRLRGKRPGEILLAETEIFSPQDHGYSRETFSTARLDASVQYCPVVAKSFGELFSKKLKSPPKVELPDWLTLIRQRDVSGFLQWVDAGGKLTEKFTDPLIDFPLTVVDYLTLEAPAEMIQPLMERGQIKPKQIRTAWQRVTACNVERFVELMPLFPKTVWPSVLMTPLAWEHPLLLEKLAEAGIDFNAGIDEEGSTPLHLAAQANALGGVKWLLAHGADANKADKYGRTPLIWAETHEDQTCRRLLLGQEGQPQPTGTAAADAPGFAALIEAESELPEGVSLMVQVQIKTPSVTRQEKLYFPEGCHYILTFDVTRKQVTYEDMTTPRQNYFTEKGPVTQFFVPIVQWPELTPLWETVEVFEFNWKQADKSRKYTPEPRTDLLEAARSALEQGFNANEATARGIVL